LEETHGKGESARMESDKDSGGVSVVSSASDLRLRGFREGRECPWVASMGGQKEREVREKGGI
jgi:hypothetical protein